LKRPQYGISLPCTFHHARDADTIVVQLRNSGLLWAIRLIDCWAPEIRGEEKPEGIDASIAAIALLKTAKELSVFIPVENIGENVLKFLTFDRIPGYLYLDDETTLNEKLIELGHATKSKE